MALAGGLLLVASLYQLVGSSSFPSTFTITIFQPQSLSLHVPVQERMLALQEAVIQAAATGSDLLICPELYASGYTPMGIFNSEVRGGPTYMAAQGYARDSNISLLFTYAEQGATKDIIYDSAVLFYRNGSVLLDYRKTNLAAGENIVLTPGDTIGPVVMVDGLLIGVLICFDIFLPEPARILALQGVNLILVPTANGYPPNVYNVLTQLIIPTRALENNAYVAYVNWVQNNASFPESFTFYGQSTVSNAGGNIIYAGPNNSAALAHVTLNLTKYDPGSTALTRPYPDTVGLCDSVTTKAP